MTITVAQAAERLGVSPARVRQFISEKRIQAVRDGGRRLSVDSDSVASFEYKPLGRPPGSKNSVK